MKTSKIKCFFSRPWWLKLVFRWGETPISTLESCACHRKMIMTLKCPFTKTHKYHASSFWRENLKIKIGNPSQGAVSTAYLVIWLALAITRSQVNSRDLRFPQKSAEYYEIFLPRPRRFLRGLLPDALLESSVRRGCFYWEHLGTLFTHEKYRKVPSFCHGDHLTMVIFQVIFNQQVWY